MPMCACIGLFFGLLASQPAQPATIDPLADGYAFGTASQYADGVMDEVISNRLAWGHIDAVAVASAEVFAAVLDCSHVGASGWIELSSGKRERLLVVDCANVKHAETVEWMIVSNIVVEVDYATAKRGGFVGRGEMVRVWID